jgi:hypothetical protein
LFLSNVVLEPVVVHIKCLGAFEANCGMKDTMRSRVVGPGDRLWVAHFDKSSAERDSFLSIQEEGTDFSFSGGSSNSAKSFAENMDGSIGSGRRRRFTDAGKGGEMEKIGSTAASIG